MAQPRERLNASRTLRDGEDAEFHVMHISLQERKVGFWCP